MTNVFKIINWICRKYPGYVFGGFCLTGLCFGGELFTDTFDRHIANVDVHYGFAAYDAEFREGQSPLCGHGVMFFDQENRVVNKVDSFLFDPSSPAGIGNPRERQEQEPKRLQFRFPDFVIRDGQPLELLQNNDNNAMMMVQVSELSYNAVNTLTVMPAFPSAEPYPTCFASTGVQYESPVNHSQRTSAQAYPLQQPHSAVTVDTSYYQQQSAGPILPDASAYIMPANPVSVHASAPAQPVSAFSYDNQPAPPFDTSSRPSEAGTGYHELIAQNTDDFGRQDSNTIRLAMRWPDEDGVDGISTDSGEFYITRDQLDEILETRENLWKKDRMRKGPFTFTPYGFINVSTSYETQRTVMGDFVLYSRSPDLDGGGHSGFHIDPKSSRLGMKIHGPDVPWHCHCVKTSALFEIDFQGNNFAGTRNRGAVMMRRAFVDFTCDDTRLLVGQEWDVISPLVPQSLNYVPGSNTGNIGYRRAQVRLERTRKWNRDFSTIWQIALCDNVPNDYLTDTRVNIANSGWPMLQGRFATTFGHNPFADCAPCTIGISGHVGELTHDYTTSNIGRRRHETWSANLDVEVPLTARLQLTSELYTGTNLSPLLAGIGQGVDLYSPGPNGTFVFNPRSAEAYGGWVNLNFKMTKKFQVNAGYCVERMRNTLAGNFDGTARDKNQMLFFNGIYNWTDQFLTGLEVSQWRTDWHRLNSATHVVSDLAPGKTTRIDFLTRYSF
ncbi:MAG: hypothetical protein FWD31_03725 [Planctomycetaceae bacterium]|nr:hypothetical protein [Planctomycetaceae bacterium]